MKTRALSPIHLPLAVLLTAGLAHGQVFEKPVRIEAAGAPIDTDVGHSAPFVHDFDGDGRRDLLVGQFGEGKLRIYRNTGTETQPRYEGFEWFRAGGAVGTVPAG